MNTGSAAYRTGNPGVIRCSKGASKISCMRRLGSFVVVVGLFVGFGVTVEASGAAAAGLSSVCDADSAGSVVVYDPVGGDVFVVDVTAAGDGFTNPTVSGKVLGADTVGTAYLGGPEPTVDDVLFYSSVTGRFQFASITAADETTGHRDLDVFVDVTGTRGWSHVITGDYNGDGTGDVLFYRATDGLMRFYTTTASGRFIPLTPAYFGTRGWTHLVVGDYNGDGSDDVLWYRARDGLMRFYEVTDSGEFRALTPAYFGTRNWTTIPAGDYDGNGSDDVMFYRGDGIARFYEVDATGTFRALGAAFHPSSGFAQIESVEFTPDTPGVDLAWYHAGSDLLVATRYNVNGVINLWNPQSTGVYGEDLIIATAVTCGSAPPATGGGTFTAKFTAVRQGDAAVFVGACGETGVIDANRYRSAEVLAAIDSIGTRSLEWIANTHYDADHLGAVLDVATATGVTVGRFYDRGGSRTVKDSNTYRDYYDYVTAAGNRTSLDIGDSFTLCSGADQVTFTIVSAGTDGTAAGGVPVSEENDRGLCFHVEYHDFDLSTCGDINGTDDGSRTDVESAVAPALGDVEVAKVNHHGAIYSSNNTYVSTLSAEVAVISVGKNSFGHPDATVISRWDTYGEVFQTQSATDNAMIDGDITVTTTGVTNFTATSSSSGRSYTIPMDE